MNERKTFKVETYFRCLMEDKLHNISPSKTYSKKKQTRKRRRKISAKKCGKTLHERRW